MTVVRAAYDIGSGLTKCQVAEVDPSVPRRVQVLFSGTRKCLLREAMAVRGDGRIGEEALAECAAALREFRARADELGTVEHSAICTAVFREASDGQAFLEQTVQRQFGLHAEIISQEDEGEVGYLTALAMAQNEEIEGDVVAWDTGGGSFQVSAPGPEGLCVWGGSIGSAGSTAAMVEAVQGGSFAEDQSPNPCTVSDCRALAEHLKRVIGEAPAWLLAAVQRSSVIGIGGKTGAFGNCDMACGKNQWTADELWKAIERLSGSSDSDLEKMGFSTVRMILPKLVLVHTVMSTAGIATVQHIPTDGGCAGMLLCPSLWPAAAEN